MKITAIVPSAGKGLRIKSGESKPYLELNGKPILARTLEALNRCSCIDEIIVAVDGRKLIQARKITEKYKISKVKAVVKGGATRFKSVLNCLNHLSDDVDYVVIHDGVRPFITEDIVKKAVRCARKTGACVVGVPVIPTIKKIDKNLKIISTIPRSRLWAAQTPQVFKTTLILKAYKLAEARRMPLTDDSMLVEMLGNQVNMVMGSYRNIKITTPEDLELAKVLIKKKSKVVGQR